MRYIARQAMRQSLRVLFAFILALSAGAAIAEAQQVGKIRRIGLLVSASPAAAAPFINAMGQSLSELGYQDGKDIAIESRFAEGNLNRLPELASELVSLKVDVIVASGDRPIRAAREATSTIPIVMVISNDPVGLGHIASLARPGGNVTGLTTVSGELASKRLELLKEVIPKASRVTILGDPANPGTAVHFKEAETAARLLKVQLQPLEVRTPQDLKTAFRTAVKGRADALIIVSGGLFGTLRTQIVSSAADHRLPAIYTEGEYVYAGGLMAYAASIPHQFRRAATYVDKILKGAKPADLPVEQPMKFELVINLKAAKQIGLTIPPNVLARADKVIK